MFGIELLCVGKMKENYLQHAQNEYLKRLTGFCRPKLTELEPYRCSASPSDAEIARVIEEEGKLLYKKLPARHQVISLCIEGKPLSSEAFAQHLAALPGAGYSGCCFVIGGSFGLSGQLKDASGLRLSFSPMTFPHQLVRVMLLEQIYRAFQIQSNGKYHK